MAKAAKATEKAPPTGTHEKGTSVRPPATSAYIGYLSMLALALQFGLQPVLNRAFAGDVRSNAVMVIMCEGCKFILAALAIAVKLRTNPRLLSSWNLVDSLKFSGLPACTYAVQNVLIQLSMRFLSPLEFNLINQSKLIWTAVFVYVLLHRRFSIIQCGGVMKSYSLIGGIALTGVLEAFMYQRALSNDLYIASGLVVASMYLYSSYPYVEHGPAKPKQQ
ncbi:hypothetical protein DYB32_009726 [Aphanomyces invadans]|uniref:Uncharacterized protein n=1 Tax=Aphanomyces invadans TaxID=157072 RepID=A0A418AHN5_9STRA|nr:hypothetical protein DYB32_009726 [Aphanomyces invadans]